MTDRELMQQALDGWDSRGGFPILAKAMEAIRERLAQQEQKPVPWESFFKRYCPWLEQPEQDVPATRFGNMGPVGWLESPDGAFRANPLYKIKFPSKLLSWQVPLCMALPQPEQEPLANINLYELVRSAFHAGIKTDFKTLDFCEKQVEQFLNTAPPQRKPLTDELLETLEEIASGLESARIWGGMDWSYNPLHPYKYLPLRDKARAAIDKATGESK